MTKLWPLKVGLLNQKSIWRGLAPAIFQVKFDGHTVIIAVQYGPEMMIRWPSILGSWKWWHQHLIDQGWCQRDVMLTSTCTDYTNVAHVQWRVLLLWRTDCWLCCIVRLLTSAGDESDWWCVQVTVQATWHDTYQKSISTGFVAVWSLLV